MLKKRDFIAIILRDFEAIFGADNILYDNMGKEFVAGDSKVYFRINKMLHDTELTTVYGTTYRVLSDNYNDLDLSYDINKADTNIMINENTGIDNDQSLEYVEFTRIIDRKNEGSISDKPVKIIELDYEVDGQPTTLTIEKEV